ncbi:hypothetical protein DF186_25265, partial [Enterococcus hirae]
GDLDEIVTDDDELKYARSGDLLDKRIEAGDYTGEQCRRRGRERVKPEIVHEQPDAEEEKQVPMELYAGLPPPLEETV